MDKLNYHNSLIADYLSERINSCWVDSVINFTLEQNNLQDAIIVAVRSKNEYGYKHSHQWRIYNYVYDEFITNLLNIKVKIQNSKNFDELFQLIERYKPSGAGELICYDVSLRIGYYLKLLPEKIYIHAGTRIGLENLLNRKIYENTILKEKLPEPFRSCELTPGQLEDFLCIYKKHLSVNGNQIIIKKKMC